MGKERKNRGARKATFTVEASVVMCIFLFVIGAFLNLSIQLYRDNIEQIKEYKKESLPEVPQALRIRHLGGNEYEQYRIQHNL